MPRPWAPLESWLSQSVKLALTAGTLLVTAASLAQAQPLPPQLRPELSQTLSNLTCSHKLDNRPTALWQQSLFEAQLEGFLMERPGGMPARIQDVEAKAKGLARLRRYGGYAYGLCKNGTGWGVALPAAAPLAEERGNIKLALTALKSHCSSYRADFAAHSGFTQELPISSAGLIKTSSLASGVISVTCQPRWPRWLGPQLWYLWPHGDGPAATPHAALLQEPAPSTAVLALWINAIRREVHLPPLTVSTLLNEQAELLAIDSSINHNRNLLQKTAANLKLRQLRLIGENRVKSSNNKDLAWLLWNSPRHRELLLNKEANHLGMALRSIGSENLAVVVLGEYETIPTASKASSSHKAAF